MFISKTRTRDGFTLVELLVVVSIIVILMALLVPALNKALRASQKSKCSANQRNIAQQLSGYSLQQRYVLPPATVNTRTKVFDDTANNQGDIWLESGDFAYAMDYRAVSGGTVSYLEDRGPVLAARSRSPLVLAAAGVPMYLAATADPDAGATNISQKPLGLGILVAVGALPATKLGEIVNCPSLNTNAAKNGDGTPAPAPKFGMDETYAIPAGNQKANSPTKGAGGSFYLDPVQADARIVGSYNYRALSFALKRGGTATIQYNQIGPQFVLTMDNPDVRYGRKYCHKDGYNIAYGDGSCQWFIDTPDGNGFSSVERLPGVNGTSIDGKSGYETDTDESVDEGIFEYVKVARNK